MRAAVAARSPRGPISVSIPGICGDPGGAFERHNVAPCQGGTSRAMTEPRTPRKVSMARPRSPIVLIPARMKSTRLPGKPLADIAGQPMIVQVWRRAMEAGLGPVCVAAAEPEIAEAVTKAGGTAVLTDPEHPSGSDRIFEALRKVDPDGRHDAVVNLQGDLPTIDAAIIRRVLDPLDEAAVDIGTLAVEITRDAERTDSNVVKAVAAFDPADAKRIARALYFSRATVPSNQGPHYHHIGLYAYRRAALERFVAMPP